MRHRRFARWTVAHTPPPPPPPPRCSRLAAHTYASAFAAGTAGALFSQPSCAPFETLRCLPGGHACAAGLWSLPTPPPPQAPLPRCARLAAHTYASAFAAGTAGALCAHRAARTVLVDEQCANKFGAAQLRAPQGSSRQTQADKPSRDRLPRGPAPSCIMRTPHALILIIVCVRHWRGTCAQSFCGN